MDMNGKVWMFIVIYLCFLAGESSVSQNVTLSRIFSYHFDKFLFQ